nr:MAG TPA: hypothetical protein [Caudoviricetes sp.]
MWTGSENWSMSWAAIKRRWRIRRRRLSDCGGSWIGHTPAVWRRSVRWTRS